MRRLAMCLLLGGCISGNDYDDTLSRIELEENDEMAAALGVASNQATLPPLEELVIKVNWRQWICCWDTCGRKNNLEELTKSNMSKYLDCHCKDGRIFELRKKGKVARYTDPGTPYKAYRKYKKKQKIKMRRSS